VLQDLAAHAVGENGDTFGPAKRREQRLIAFHRGAERFDEGPEPVIGPLLAGPALARGRKLLGGVVPFDYVWRTGANAATQFRTSAPITLAGIAVPPGTYTLWTIPREKGGADLIVNKQSGQWGTDYDGARDLGTAPMQTETPSAPVDRFTISIIGVDDKRGTLAIEWGPFRWTAPIMVDRVTSGHR